MKKAQWITIASAIILVIIIYSFGKTTPNDRGKVVAGEQHSANDGHDHGPGDISSDTILNLAKKQISPEQVVRLNMLENTISRGDVKEQQLKVYHQLSHFWGDSIRMFEPYAWYEAEAARLENSEKTLTFAAHLFLENLQQDRDPRLIKWKALQAKDLFERSLKINANNDSTKIGLGALYLFGNISAAPMEGIAMIKEVVDRDSTNVFGQMTLAKGSLVSAQYDKAIERLRTIVRLQPANLEAILLLADVYERTGNKASAAIWYEKSLPFVNRDDAKNEIQARIAELKK